MIESWGAWAVGTAVSGGIAGAVTCVAVRTLRLRPGHASLLLLLGLIHLAVPPVLPAPSAARGVLKLAGGVVGVEAIPDRLPLLLVIFQATGLVVGVGLLAVTALRVRRLTTSGGPPASGPLAEEAARLSRAVGISMPRIVVTDGFGPAAAGIFRPALLLPGDLLRRLRPAELRQVLAHEIEHLARRDPLTGCARLLVLSLWWFHPIAWLLARAHRRAAEDACDDAALEAGAERAGPEDYCALLLACARGRHSPGFAVPLARPPLERRFRRLLGGPGRPRGPGWAGPALAALLSVGLAFQGRGVVSGKAGARMEVGEDVVRAVDVEAVRVLRAVR